MDLLKGLKLIWFVSSTPKLYKYRYKYFLALLQVYSHLTWRQTVKYVKCKIQGQPLILLCILLHGFRALLSFLLFFSRKLKYFLTISTRTTKVFFSSLILIHKYGRCIWNWKQDIGMPKSPQFWSLWCLAPRQPIRIPHLSSLSAGLYDDHSHTDNGRMSQATRSILPCIPDSCKLSLHFTRCLMMVTRISALWPCNSKYLQKY